VLIVSAWTCFLVGLLILDQPWTPARHRTGQALLVAWFVLATLAFYPAFFAIGRGHSGRSHLVAAGLLAACLAMPIFLFVLAATGYFADYGS
jgi:hypothetical protein